MARLPLSPLLAVAVATVSSTGHGGLDLGQIANVQVGEPELPGGLASMLHRAGDKIVAALDGLRAAAKLDVPDLTALRVEPITNATTSGFGWRRDPWTKRKKFHAGTDIRGKYGTPVMAAGDGTVILAGYKGGYGNVIFVDHGNGIVTRYAHLSRIETKVKAQVTAGQRIGKVGATGRTTGPHLHFEVRIDGRPVDPMTALMVGQLERESPALGRIAARVLGPEYQSNASSNVDPPPSSKQPKLDDRPKKKTKRPRPVRVAKPLS